ncbi:hypothetical protein HHI36_021554 [Cryptolaemus montrouzieri]|uniref:Methylated-DNA--protein-cysteine methyltransferase n=1 Tax=Cryptolaemus montrouzieri TaxID=559131 RepID=A0ABD2MYG6_9CUCU
MAKINIVNDSSINNELTYGVGDSEFGQLFVVINETDGLCFSAFIDNPKTIPAELGKVKKIWPKANFTEDNAKIAKIVTKIFKENNSESVDLKLTGTDFQVSVWKAISNLKEGSTASYEDIAKAIGNPKAIRAVASAVANNKLAYLIPCHRVISKGGGLSKYKWGGHRKVKLLTHEKAI